MLVAMNYGLQMGFDKINLRLSLPRRSNKGFYIVYQRKVLKFACEFLLLWLLERKIDNVSKTDMSVLQEHFKAKIASIN